VNDSGIEPNKKANMAEELKTEARGFSQHHKAVYSAESSSWGENEVVWVVYGLCIDNGLGLKVHGGLGAVIDTSST
jgi:hypothetical protein